MPQNSEKTSSKSHQKVDQGSTKSSAQLCRGTQNPRFVVTPESMGMHMTSDSSIYPRAQILPQEPPLVEVKSYYERHNNRNKPKVGITNYTQESNASFNIANCYGSQNSFSVTNTTSATEILTHSPSPNISPNTPSQQWCFDSTTKCESSAQNVNCGHSDRDLAAIHPSSITNATHPHSQFIQDFISKTEIEAQIYKSISNLCGDESPRSNFKNFNDMFEKRIEEIDRVGCGNKDLKISTYQEWIDILTRVNESFIENIEDLEREMAVHIDLLHKKSSGNCRHSQENELIKCRKDIVTLLKYIRDSPGFNKRELLKLTFETMTPSQMLLMAQYDAIAAEGNGDENAKNQVSGEEKNKLLANIKALAQEVAEKHDEVRELKRQVICLEDEIQKAQKKIQLKDDVIKELRSDLKTANNKLSFDTPVSPTVAMAPANFDSRTSRSGNTEVTDINPTCPTDSGSQFDSLSHTEMEEQNKIKLLQEEICGFFEMNNDLNKQKMDNQRKRILEIFGKLESEKDAAYRKLDFIRRQLIDLESESPEGNNNDSDSGFHSKSENGQDAKLINAVRKRLLKLNQANSDLKKKLQKLEMEKNEISNNLHSEQVFSQCNGEALKQIADLLCTMTGQQFSYTEIYNTNIQQINPFCDAILKMQNDFQEKENQLLKVLNMRNKQNEELSEIMRSEKDYNDDRVVRMYHSNVEDVDSTITTTTTLLSTPSQPMPINTSHSITVALQPSLSSSTSLTGQQCDNITATSFHGLVDK